MGSTGRKAALTGALAAAAVAGGVVLGPALATAATTEQSAGDAVTGHVERLREALQGLVGNGTIDEAQADAVAEELAAGLPRGRGGPGGKHVALDVAAEVLGTTEQELVAELRSGRSLADVAGDQVDELEAALQTAAEERLDQAVTDGRLTQEQADERKAELPERIAAAVEREGLPGRGRGHGPGGRHGGPPPAAGDESDDRGTDGDEATEPQVEDSVHRS